MIGDMMMITTTNRSPDVNIINLELKKPLRLGLEISVSYFLAEGIFDG